MFNLFLLVTIEQSIIKAVYSHHVISSSTLVADGIEHSTSCHLCLMFYIRFEIRVKQLRDDPYTYTQLQLSAYAIKIAMVGGLQRQAYTSERDCYASKSSGTGR